MLSGKKTSFWNYSSFSSSSSMKVSDTSITRGIKLSPAIPATGAHSGCITISNGGSPPPHFYKPNACPELAAMKASVTEENIKAFTPPSTVTESVSAIS